MLNPIVARAAGLSLRLSARDHYGRYTACISLHDAMPGICGASEAGYPLESGDGSTIDRAVNAAALDLYDRFPELTGRIDSLVRAYCASLGVAPVE